ncbi:MAG: AIPR family protein, partial [Verrucomicrobiota bacterium]
MDLEQFLIDLQQRVAERCADDASPQMQEDAFTEVVLDQLAEGGGDVCYHQADRHGRRPASKVNAWNLSADGTALSLFVALYHGSTQVEMVPRAEVDKHFKLLRGFLVRALSGFHVELEESFEAFDAARRIHQVKSDIVSVRLVFLTDGAVRSAEVEKEQQPGFSTSYEFWDLKELRNLAMGEPEPIELDFVKDHGGAVSCLARKDATGEFTTYLAFFPAELLHAVYAKFGMRLLEKNVRAFLSAKGKVNKPIQETIRDAPHRFLAYNNGLAATAAAVRVKDKGDGHAQLEWARDFQIVNGGQTTASIHHAKVRERADISDVVVQVKLTVVNDQSMVEEFVPLISKFTNSQNKVNTSAFSANSPFHRAVERLSRTITFQPADGMERGNRWYYERAQGSYLNDKNNMHPPAARKEWERMHPTAQKFSKTDLAKFEHTWAGLPYLVCLGAEKNFLKFADGQEADGEPPVDEM